VVGEIADVDEAEAKRHDGRGNGPHDRAAERHAYHLMDRSNREVLVTAYH